MVLKKNKNKKKKKINLQHHSCSQSQFYPQPQNQITFHLQFAFLDQFDVDPNTYLQGPDPRFMYDGNYKFSQPQFSNP